MAGILPGLAPAPCRGDQYGPAGILPLGMAEGLSAEEVGKEISERARSGHKDDAQERRDRKISIIEAVLLSMVALLAGWSGYAAAKWSTESRVKLAEASTVRSEANRANLQAMSLRNFDSSTFDAWFSAYTVHNKQAMLIAERRFRPKFRVAFDAWRATHPETNPNAPKGPTYMPEYRQPRLKEAAALDAQATKDFADGSEAGGDLRQVRAGHRLPGERPVPHRNQHPVPTARSPVCAGGGRGRPAPFRPGAAEPDPESSLRSLSRTERLGSAESQARAVWR